MVKLSSLIGLVTAGICTYASPSSLSTRGGHKECPPFKKGTFVIDSYQLYPENADWDPDSCQLLIGSVWNGTVVIYDPYKDKVTSVLEYPGVSYTATYHIGGVAWDPYTGLYTILTDPAASWATGGADVSGDHLIIKHNPKTKTTLWSLNMTVATGGRYGGFQDIETDRRGNTYVVGTWPGTIMRADARGKAVKPWYVPDPLPPTTQKGFSGLASVGENLLSVDGDGQIYRFDMRDAKKGTPVLVPIRPKVLYNETDAIYAPPMYGGSVLLVATWTHGIQVLRSRDKSWKTAEYLGTVPLPTDSPLYDGGAGVAVTQIGPDAIYIIFGFIDFPFVEGTVAGPRSLFPMPDITARVERLLRK
ncbi:hypothetical protein B0H66DRAFT_552657 [Apodospora peruviana]|uniref:Uncharacterized protein n=1 Tax=Apodospora peruviana TaxID=516989 RepID=A0AAE0M748_9PEZI|nr:hypothetical protein B0H66DRAFT_552657 [Apodospora peruviana]